MRGARGTPWRRFLFLHPARWRRAPYARIICVVVIRAKARISANLAAPSQPDGPLRKKCSKSLMRAATPNSPKMTTRLQLALLLAAAMACVATMLASFVGDGKFESASLDVRQLSLLALIAGAAFIAGLIVWHMGSVARREAREAKAESQNLRRNLAAAEAIIRAEPQVLVFWEQGHAVRIVSHTLTGIPGLPQQHT